MLEKKENIFINFLKRIGLIKEKEIGNNIKKELCKNAIKSGICPKLCEGCAWNIK